MSSETGSAEQFYQLRRIATLLLLLMTAVFFAASFYVPTYSWLAWVKAFAEAAMVGALADWFAVTALFRRPLGLPIPHTAIIPNNQARIGRALGEFVQNNFLSSQNISQKISDSKPSAKVSAWLGQSLNASNAAGRILKLGSALTRTSNDQVLGRFLRNEIDQMLKRLKCAPLLHSLLGALTQSGRHHGLLEDALKELERLLAQHEVFIRESLRHEMPWWMPDFVHDKLYATVVRNFKTKLAAINADPHHPARKKAEVIYTDCVARLKSDPSFSAKVEDIFQSLVSQPQLRTYLDSLWQDLSRHLAEESGEPSSPTLELLAGGLQALANSLSSQPDLLQRCDELLTELSKSLVEYHGDQISNLIAETVQGWDSETLVNKLEPQVGKDLQFIRINGTLVGGLVGLLLHSIS